ncbi:MAG TPA: SRPBCC family protein [Ferruginibacter sp.]|nr:SRPBCC family protein [Ferruginibacter sp.]HRO17334.1 SRPBCC family protein [Ferruginibacter sp.]HRQ21231.1 SRPBCC family protein [Ferruginibacter sp.]
MAFYQFIKTQKIPATMSAVWDFMSSPMNLKDITPSYMNFTVTNQSGQGKMYPGMIITYTVSPLMGIPLNWMTEITHVKEMEYFVDEQRSGPYKLWHHQHKIEPIEGGVLMTDIVTYAPPLGMLGQLANTLFIRRQLESIFEFRRLAVEKKFGIY